jgi:hypothetical protein
MPNAPLSPEIDYNYGTRTRKTLGNVLDLYDAPTYNLRLYMIPFSDVVAGQFTSDAEVTIAQTGVTGLVIDNLSLELVGGGMRMFEPRKVSFTITEPSSVEFLDRLVALRAQMGYRFESSDGPVVPEGFPVFLEIRFRGYPSPEGRGPGQRDDNARAGDAEQIGPVFRYRLEIRRVELRIDTTGSSYDIDAVVLSASGQDDIYLKAPKEITTRGITVKEHLDDFIKSLGDIEEEHNSSHVVKDEYAIDLSLIEEDLGGEAGWLEGEIDYQLFDYLDWARMTDPEFRNMTREEFEALDLQTKQSRLSVVINNGVGVADADRQRRITAAQEARRSGGVRNFAGSLFDEAGTRAAQSLSGARRAIDRVVDGDQKPPIAIRRGVSYEYYLFTLFALGPQERFYDLVTRGDPNDNSIDRGTLVKRLVVTTKVDLLGFDIGRRTFAKKITYIPRLISGNYEAHAVRSSEDSNLTAEEIQRRFEALPVDKYYAYMFTGLNDQITNMDITYNQGMAILLSPYQGAHTQAELSPQGVVGNSEDENRELLIRERTNTDTTNQAGSTGDQVHRYLEDVEPNSELSSVSLRYRSNGNERPSVATDANSQPAASSRANRLANLYTNSMEETATFMYRQELSLRGDPYYLGQANVTTVDQEFETQQRTPTRPEEFIPIRDQMPHYVFEMQLPRQEDQSSEDDDDLTGLWGIKGKSYFLTGLYMVRNVVNTFNGGLFETKVTGVRQTMFDAAKLEQISSETENQLPGDSPPPQAEPGQQGGNNQVSDDNPQPVQGTNPRAGDPAAPRSVRNNNPGNIRTTNIPWQGKIGNDGEFEIFDSQESGGRALMRNLRTRVESLGDDATMSSVITAWAPPSENDTNAYIQFVTRQAGIGSDQVLDWNNQAQMASLARAISIKETGTTQTPDDWKNPLWWNARYRAANTDRSGLLGVV